MATVQIASLTPQAVRLAATTSYGDVEREMTVAAATVTGLRQLTAGCSNLPRMWVKPSGLVYEPHGIQAIQTVSEWPKVKSLVRDVEQYGAGHIPPILVDQGILVTGTHRWVANELLERRSRTLERVRVVELEKCPLAVQFVIRLLFNSREYSKLQSAWHLLAGIPMSRRERRIKKLIDPALWACCDPQGQLRED